MSEEKKVLTPEEKKLLEQKRREARNARIQGSAAGRLGFIAEHVKKPTDIPPKPIVDDDEDDTDILNNNNNSGLRNRKDNKSNISNNGGNTSSGNDNNNNTSGDNMNNLMGKMFKRSRHVREPFSVTIFRWFGVILFSLLFASNALVICNSDLAPHHPIRHYLGYTPNTNTSYREIVYLYAPILMVWVLWEYLFAYQRIDKSNRSGSFLSMLSSDGSLIAFFYAVTVDLVVRYHQFLPHYLQSQSYIVEQQSLVPSLYYPLLLSFLGQLVINQIPKLFPIIDMNDLFSTAFKTISQVCILIISLVLFIDWWQCTNCTCEGLGVLWLIANKSRGLLLWTKICNTFTSRLLG